MVRLFERRDMIYFGNAFFREAFTLEKPLVDVFDDARLAVTEREEQMGMEPSRPRMEPTETVIDAWEQWRLG